MNTKMILLASVLSLPFTAFADMGNHEAPPHHRLERLEKELQLNAEQKAKLEVIFNEQHEKYRAIHDETHARVKEVLTPEQNDKWQAMQQQRMEKRREKMQHRQAGPQ